MCDSTVHPWSVWESRKKKEQTRSIQARWCVATRSTRTGFGFGVGAAGLQLELELALLRLLGLLQIELELALLGLVDSVARMYGVIDFSHVRLGTCCGVQVKSGK